MNPDRPVVPSQRVYDFGNKMFDKDWEDRYYYVLDWYVIAALNYRDKWGAKG